MILLALPLAALLSFGWPAMKTEWVPAGTACPPGMWIRHIPHCCKSMEPYLHGGEVGYVESYHGQSVKGYIVETPLATHQVVAETATAIKCAGASNRRSDPWQSKKDILCVFRYILRKP